MRQSQINFSATPTADDSKRFGRQLTAVLEVMSDHDWHTLGGLRLALGGKGIAASESGISARLRDLRKEPLNRHVESKRISEGVFAYRMTVRE